jgi:hypothetical protein
MDVVGGLWTSLEVSAAAVKASHARLERSSRTIVGACQLSFHPSVVLLLEYPQPNLALDRSRSLSIHGHNIRVDMAHPLWTLVPNQAPGSGHYVGGTDEREYFQSARGGEFQEITGRASCHGAACSSCPASANRVASSQRRPMK